MTESPRYNVVSMRVSDDEKEALQVIAGEDGTSLSEATRNLLILGMEARNNGINEA